MYRTPVILKAMLQLASLVVFMGLAFALPGAAEVAKLDDELAAALRGERAADGLPIIVTMREQVDLGRFARHRDTAAAMILQLQETSRLSQAGVLEMLSRYIDRGEVRSMWIVNAIALRATAEIVAALAEHPDVARIELDPTVVFPAITVEPGTERATHWNLNKIRAPEVWQTYGLDGTGIVVGVMDTGADISHPALAGKWRGGTNSWTDIINGVSTPYDDHGHGTHVTGTIVGGDGPGPFAEDIGVAYNARFIAAKVLDANNSFSSASIVIAGAEWMLDPDGDPYTADFPHVINNSWIFFSQTYTGFHYVVEAWRTAGIIPVFCIGNEGSSAGSTRPPGNYSNTLGIGATNSADNIWSSSSRGPSPTGWAFPADLRKPDLSAPGASVRSSLPGGAYASWSGTSMATPHVAGTVALMLQASPGLAYDDIRDVLFTTSVDLGAIGYDYNYGYGRLDAYEAVSAVVSYLSVNPQQLVFETIEGVNPDPEPLSIQHIGSQTLSWFTAVSNPNVTVAPSSGTTPANPSVSIDVGGYSIGTHHETITISSPDALNSPVIVDVTVTVDDGFIVSNVVVGEGPFSSIVEVSYDLQTVGGQPVTVSLFLSTDGGGTFPHLCQHVSGAVGEGVLPGTGLQITWDAGADVPGLQSETCRLRVSADDGQMPEGFVFIPPGTFTMGSPEDEPGHWEWEGPQHEVTLTQGFWMSQYAVTEQWWAEVMDETPTTSQLPKRYVSWDMAVEFCNALSLQQGLTPAYTIHGTNGDVTWHQDANGYRLPTEAEWEYACRAGSVTAFANGPITHIYCEPLDPNLDAMGWYCGNRTWEEGPSAVGQKQANAWGLYDMHGNLFEWVWCGLRTYTSSPQVDPVHNVGPGAARVIRGGVWGSYAQYCRSADRLYSVPYLGDGYGGFRPVRSAP